MVSKKKSHGRFGARYGWTVRRRVTTLETGMKENHECPQCSARSIKRESVGVWKCKKCGHTFAGGAYTPVTKVGQTAERRARSVKPS